MTNYDITSHPCHSMLTSTHVGIHVVSKRKFVFVFFFFNYSVAQRTDCLLEGCRHVTSEEQPLPWAEEGP